VLSSVSLFSLRGVSLGFQCPGAAAPGARGGELALCAGWSAWIEEGTEIYGTG
jgi:hypothetical protein